MLHPPLGDNCVSGPRLSAPCSLFSFWGFLSRLLKWCCLRRPPLGPGLPITHARQGESVPGPALVTQLPLLESSRQGRYVCLQAVPVQPAHATPCISGRGILLSARGCLLSRWSPCLIQTCTSSPYQRLLYLVGGSVFVESRNIQNIMTYKSCILQEGQNLQICVRI